MRHAIMGKYRGQGGRTEEIDTADTLKEARRLLAEYRMAFGPDWGDLWTKPIVDEGASP